MANGGQTNHGQSDTRANNCSHECDADECVDVGSHRRDIGSVCCRARVGCSRPSEPECRRQSRSAAMATARMIPASATNIASVSTAGPISSYSSSCSSKGSPSRTHLKESTVRLARKCGAVKGICLAPALCRPETSNNRLGYSEGSMRLWAQTDIKVCVNKRKVMNDNRRMTTLPGRGLAKEQAERWEPQLEPNSISLAPYCCHYLWSSDYSC